MKRIFALSIIPFLVGCLGPGFGNYESPAIPSPDGTMELVPIVKDASVQFELRGTDGKPLHRISTGAGDAMKWAIGWKDAETIVLYSSDASNKAWRLDASGNISELPWPLSAELEERAASLYEKKYGRRPRS